MAETEDQWSLSPPKGKSVDSTSKEKSGDDWSLSPPNPNEFISGKEGNDWLLKQASDAATHTAQGLAGVVTTPIKIAGKVIDIMGNTKGVKDDWDKTKNLFKETITDPMQATRDKGREMAKSSNRSTATMGGLTYAAGMIPLAGPAVGQVTSNIGEGNIGAGLGDLASLYLSGKAPGWVGKGLEKTGESAYGASLRLTKQGRMEAAPLIKKGVSEGLDMGARGLERVNELIKKEGFEKDLITKDQNNPNGFALNTVPLAPITQAIYDSMAFAKRSRPDLYGQVIKLVKAWEKNLDQSPKPIVSTLLGPNGKPINIPSTVAKYTTVEKVQILKEDLSRMLRESSFNPGAKTAEMGVEQGTMVQAEITLGKTVTKATNDMVAGVNKNLHQHILIRNAIIDAMSRNPTWINDWAIFAVGAGIERMIGNLAQEGVAPGLGASVAAGAILRAAIRMPRAMSRLGIALHASGINLQGLDGIFQATTAAGLATKKGKVDTSNSPIPTGIDVEYTTEK